MAANNTPRFFVLIPCAGAGSRFGGKSGALPKQYAKIDAKTVLHRTLEVFIHLPIIEQIIIVVNPHDKHIDEYAAISPKIVIARVGGEYRAQSVLNGLRYLSCHGEDWVLVHDAARCCISAELIQNLIDKVGSHPVGGILATIATDTIKLGQNNKILQTLNREQIYLAQTPQMFRYKVLLSALNNTDLANTTDEAACVEQLGLEVCLIEGSQRNIKVTYPEDIALAKFYLGVN